MQLIVVTDGCHDVARGTVAVNIGRGFVCGIGDVVGMDADLQIFLRAICGHEVKGGVGFLAVRGEDGRIGRGWIAVRGIVGFALPVEVGTDGPAVAGVVGGKELVLMGRDGRFGFFAVGAADVVVGVSGADTPAGADFAAQGKFEAACFVAVVIVVVRRAVGAQAGDGGDVFFAHGVGDGVCLQAVVLPAALDAGFEGVAAFGRKNAAVGTGIVLGFVDAAVCGVEAEMVVKVVGGAKVGIEVLFAVVAVNVGGALFGLPAVVTRSGGEADAVAEVDGGRGIEAGKAFVLSRPSR